MSQLYEGMFLVSPMAGEGEAALEPVKRVLDRAKANVKVCKNWDDRRLAYEIGGQRRGLYVLSYFEAEGDRIADIERDVQLSDELLRVLIVRADDVTEEEMSRATPAEQVQSDAPAAERGESESNGDRRADDESEAKSDE